MNGSFLSLSQITVLLARIISSSARCCPETGIFSFLPACRNDTITRRPFPTAGEGADSMSQDQEAAPSREERLKQLWLDQKHTLDVFLEHGAISKAQYEKSLGDLTKKMGINIAGEGKSYDPESNH